jgi:hypothetical protein
MEEQFTANGTYAAAALTTLKQSEGNVVTLAAGASTTAYCLNANHSKLGETADSIDFHLSSATGRPAAGPCA